MHAISVSNPNTVTPLSRHTVTILGSQGSSGVVVRKVQDIAWWRALRGRWVAVGKVHDVDDMGDMGTAFGLDACLQADLEFQAFQESRRALDESTPPPTDRLNGRSVR